MKLAIVTRPYVFSGGIETATAGLVRALVSRGHDVHTFTPGGGAAVPGVTPHRLPLPPLPAAARALTLAAVAAAAVRRRTWDAVHSSERTLAQDVYRAGEGCHRAFLDATGWTRGRAVHHRVTLALERRVLARTPRVVAIARRGRDEIATHYRVPTVRLAVVYNGVDLARFHPERRPTLRAGARAEAALPREACALLFLGSGFARKGLDIAIETLARLDDRAARLLVLGRGDERPYRALADRVGVGARVAWLGARLDVERWYAAADVLVLPTRYEPFGNVHLEALASGLPVITTTRAGGAEVMAPEYGAVVPPDDTAAVARQVERLRCADAKDVAGRARAAAEPFTYERQAAAFEEIYRSLGASG